MALTAEQQADLEAEEYFKQNNPSMAGGKGMFANVPMISPVNTEDQTEKKPPSWLTPTGAATGAFTAYKGIGSNLFRPAPNLFAPRGGNSPTATFNAQESEIQKIMQSLRGKDEPSGRQMESGHNWESQRQSMTTKHNLAMNPGAESAIVQAGKQFPTKETGIGLPEHEARIVEEQRLRKRALEILEQNKSAARIAALKGALSGVAKIGTGALGGLLTAKEGYDLYEEVKKNGWSDEAIRKALQTGGGLAMMTGSVPGVAAGALATGAGMLYPFREVKPPPVYDRNKK